MKPKESMLIFVLNQKIQFIFTILLALDTLKICFKLDPNNQFKESAKTDEDLVNIRVFPAFQKLIKL